MSFSAGRAPRGLDRFELAVLVVFVSVAGWVLAVDLWPVVSHGRVWPGTDSVYLEDQMQYLAWIRDASQHVLVSNLFVLRATPHDYLQPAIAISGGLVALGLAPWVALLVWQPVAVGAVFLAVRAFVHRQLAGHVSRRVALVVALFGGWVGMFPDLWLPFWTWGYPFALLALACLLGSLLAYGRARSTPRSVWAAALLGGLAAWLHPWEGEVLLLVVLGGEGIMWASGQRPSPARILPVLAATLLPLGYYLVLAHSDPSWQLGQQASGGRFPLSTLTLALAPMAVPALLAYRSRPATFLAAATRVWPPAAVVVFLFAEHRFRGSPMHAFLGISVPLAVLAVEGVATFHWRPFRFRPALAALAALTLAVPVEISETTSALQLVRRSQQGNLITASEWRALGYLAHDPQPGGVLTAWHLGELVPGETGRHTYLGNLYWSQPNPHQRAILTWDLLNGAMRPPQARTFVRSTHAQFLLADCRSAHDLGHELAAIIKSERRFGCTNVYELRSPKTRRESTAARPPLSL